MRSPAGAYLALIVVLAVGLGAWQHAQNGKVHRAQVASCARGNIVRGYLLLRAREFQETDERQPSETTQLAPQLFPILDCHAEPPRPLTRQAQEKYLRLLPALTDR